MSEQQQMYEATLVRGERYSLGGRIFEYGAAQIVNEEIKAHLDDNAVDKGFIKIGKDVTPRNFPKFNFNAVNAEAQPGPVGFELPPAEDTEGLFIGDDAEDEGDIVEAEATAKAAAAAKEEPAPAKPRARSKTRSARKPKASTN